MIEGQGFRDRASDFSKLDAEIVGISFDTPEENAAFAEEYDFPYPLLSDADRSVGEAYEVRRPEDHQAADFPRRFSYLISPEGKIARAYFVDDVTQHPADVLADLAQLSRLVDCDSP